MGKVEFFHNPSKVAEILEGKKVKEADTNLERVIAGMRIDEAVIISNPIIPAKFLNAEKPSVKFERYGYEAVLQVPCSREEAVKRKLTPKVLLEQALRSMPYHAYSGISYISLADYRTHNKIFFDEMVKGAKMYAYSAMYSPIEVNEYSDARAAEEIGANFNCLVPSTEPKNRRYSVLMKNIAAKMNKDAHYIWTAAHGKCGCERKAWYSNNFKKKMRGGKTVFVHENIFCEHEIAAYIAIAAHCKKKGNDVPAIMMPFPIVSEEMVSYWNKLRKNVMIADNGKRKLTGAERSILLSRFILTFGFDAAFSNEKKPKKLWEYCWKD